MDLKQIETFLAIAKYESFTKSAEVLYISQSTVSSRLKALEAELDVKLVNRKKGHPEVTLTEKGREFIEIAQQWVEVYEKTRMLSKKRKFKTVNYAGPESINQLLSGFYKELMENERDLSLYVRTCQSVEVSPLLLEKSIDMGFTYIYNESKDIYMREIGRQNLNVVMKTNRDKELEDISIEELSPEKEVQVRGVVENVPELAEWHERHFGKCDSAYLDVDNPVMLVNSMGEGSWCLQAKSLTGKIINIPGIRVFRIQERPPQLICYLAVRRASMQYNSALKLFEKYMTGEV